MSFSKNIIGKGFIAKNLFRINSLIIKSKYTIYAAGISNSKIKSQKELSREVNMFKKFFIKNKNKKIIYISTADATNNLKNKSKYVKNKIKIEKFIIKESKNYLILRIPQIIGESKNKNILINYFYYCIKNRKKIELLGNVRRNVLDIDDVIKMIKIIILNSKINNKIITLSNKFFIKPIEIVKIFEKKLKKKAIFYIKKSKKYQWNLNFKKNVIYFRKAKINFHNKYLINAINKYYK